MDAIILAATSTNVSLFWILLVLSGFAIFIAWLYYIGEKENDNQYKPWRREEPADEGAEVRPAGSYWQNQSKQTTTTTTTPTKPFSGEGMGAPLFGMNKKLAFNLDIGDKVWILTPYGPFIFVVSGIMNHEGTKYAMLANEGFSAVAKWDEKYLHETITARMGRVAGVWRLEDIEPIKFKNKNTPEAKAANFRWVREEADLGDFFDDILWYHFLFDGFTEELETYQAMEVQTIDWVPELALEDVLEDEEDTVEVPVEELPTPETFEETAEVEHIPAEEEPLIDETPAETEDVDFESPEPTPGEPNTGEPVLTEPESEPIETEPEPEPPKPEPIRTSEPPAYEPPPEPEPEKSNWGWGNGGGFGSSDDGGGWDDGGDGGDD